MQPDVPGPGPAHREPAETTTAVVDAGVDPVEYLSSYSRRTARRPRTRPSHPPIGRRCSPGRTARSARTGLDPSPALAASLPGMNLTSVSVASRPCRTTSIRHLLRSCRSRPGGSRVRLDRPVDAGPIPADHRLPRTVPRRDVFPCPPPLRLSILHLRPLQPGVEHRQNLLARLFASQYSPCRTIHSAAFAYTSTSGLRSSGIFGQLRDRVRKRLLPLPNLLQRRRVRRVSLRRLGLGEGGSGEEDDGNAGQGEDSDGTIDWTLRQGGAARRNPTVPGNDQAPGELRRAYECRGLIRSGRAAGTPGRLSPEESA